MSAIIHIHAKCNFFEIFEHVPENKAVKRLEKIKEMYLWSKTHKQEVLPRRKKSRVSYNWLMPKVMDESNKLSVKTCVVNPELPFINCY